MILIFLATFTLATTTDMGNNQMDEYLTDNNINVSSCDEHSINCSGVSSFDLEKPENINAEDSMEKNINNKMSPQNNLKQGCLNDHIPIMILNDMFLKHDHISNLSVSNLEKSKLVDKNTLNEETTSRDTINIHFTSNNLPIAGYKMLRRRRFLANDEKLSLGTSNLLKKFQPKFKCNNVLHSKKYISTKLHNDLNLIINKTRSININPNNAFFYDINNDNNIILRHNTCKKISLENFVGEIDSFFLDKLLNYSKDINEEIYIIETFKSLLPVFEVDFISFESKIEKLIHFITSFFCDYKTSNDLKTKKSFIFLALTMTELFPYIYFLNQNYKNLLLHENNSILIFDIFQKMIFNIDKMIVKYKRMLIFIFVTYDLGTLSNVQNRIIGYLQTHLYNEILNVRLNISELNEYLLEKRDIGNYYNHFLTSYKNQKNCLGINSDIEVYFFYSFVFNRVDIKKLFRNVMFDDHKKQYLTSKLNRKNIHNRLYLGEDIIMALYKDLSDFFSFFSYAIKLNNDYVYLKTNYNICFFINKNLPGLQIDEMFYATNISYMRAIYETFARSCIQGNEQES